MKANYNNKENSFIYGIKKGSMITIHHLIVVIIYCAYSNLQYKFCETFRRLEPLNEEKKHDNIVSDPNDFISSLRQPQENKESYECMKYRNSSFHHLSKYLFEAVNIFSKPAYKQNIGTFYHGITQPFVFDAMNCSMYQPFSTTSVWAVAVNFAQHTGLVIELMSGVNTHYFDCCWISDFANERELLFFQTEEYLTFMNITNISKGVYYESFIKAISILSSVADGTSFVEDNKIIQNANKAYNKLDADTVGMEGPIDPRISSNCSLDPMFYKAKPIRLELKSLTIKLIEHELSRYYPQKYKRFNNIHGYIDQLLHNVCIKRHNVCFDKRLMDLEITQPFYQGGYGGYLFLRDLFCEKEYEMIKLDV
eukprot:303785_1